MKNIDYKRIGQRVRAKRKELDVSQKKAAKLAGVGFHYWSNIESGNVDTIGFKTLFAMSNFLGVGIDYFVVDSIENNEKIVSEEIGNMLKKMNKEQRIMAMDLINVVYNNPRMFEIVEVDEDKKNYNDNESNEK